MEILYSPTLQMHALRQYVPVAVRMSQPSNPQKDKESRFTYNFKKHNKNRQTIKKEILTLYHHLQCQSIAIAPPHDVKQNNLQKLFNNTTFTRITQVEARKFTHKKPINTQETQTLKIDLTHLKSPVLLIDDVCVTGRSLLFYEKILTDNGFQVQKLALAFHHKIPHQKSTITPTQPTKQNNTTPTSDHQPTIGDIVYLKSDLNYDNPFTITQIITQQQDDYQKIILQTPPKNLVQITNILANGTLSKEIIPQQALKTQNTML